MSKAKKPKALPNKLSELILLAVDDCEKLAKDKRYRLRMFSWHDPGTRKGEPCSVCMAGAVMACDLGAERTDTLDALQYRLGAETMSKLDAINMVREGFVYDALRYLGADDSERGLVDDAAELIARAYNRNTGRAPFRVYRKAARMLAEVGL